MALVKVVGEVQVKVSFSSRQPSNFDQDQQEDQQQEQLEENHENNENQEEYCDFSVVLTRKGQSIVYECSSLDSEVNVQNIVYLSNADVDTYLQKNKFDRFAHQYNGPDFDTLDEKLQNDMMEYLRAHGVNEELAAIVEHLSLDKEQRLYQSWLKNVHQFL